MKKDQIKKNLNHHVRLRPVARWFDSNGDLNQLDDDWIIESYTDEGVRIKNLRTDHTTILGFDQIHSYMSDPNRNYSGIKYGVLILNVQLHIHGWKVSFEPTERPGKADDPPSSTREKEVQEIIDEYYAALKSKKYFKGIEGKGICALAIVPEVSSIKLDLSNLPGNFNTLFEPIYYSSGSLSSEITGRSRFTFGCRTGDRVPYAVTEVTGLGQVKAYNSSMLQSHYDMQENRYDIPNIAYECKIITTFYRYLTSLKGSGVSGPFFIHTALLNVQGYTMYTERISGGRVSQSEDIRPLLRHVPNDTHLETKQDVAKAVRPMFDYICREFGFDKSFNYSEEDEWLFPFNQ
jgi:hypothetical protein